MEIIEEEITWDGDGKKLKRKFKSAAGIAEDVLLLEPSNSYKQNVMKPMQDEGKIRQKQADDETKIANKIRDMAIKELKKDREL
jgi:hypothetical protein|tara:strand:+ start:16147 stop:16398 length:252 start_codon:yes stop_codon:yes gene_type:complete